MAESIAETAKKILAVSYNIYDDLNSINTAFIRSGSIIGLQFQKAQLTNIDVSSSKKTGESLPVTSAVVTSAGEPVLKVKSSMQQEAANGELAPLQNATTPVVTMQDVKMREKPKGIKEEKVLPAPLQTPKTQETKPVAQPMAAATIISEKKQTLALKEERMTNLEKSAISAPKSMRPKKLAPISTEIFQENPLTGTDVTVSMENPISKLLNIVKTRHTLTVSEAANELHVDKALIETWAKILNRNSLLKLKYQLIGDMILEA